MSSELSTSNFGGSASLLLGHELTGSKNDQSNFYYILLRFDLTSLSGAQITDAQLTLSNLGGSVSQTLNVRRLTQTAWTELGATWNSYNGVNLWTSSGAGADTTTPTATTAWTSGDLSFNITSLVTDAVQNRSGIFNCRIDTEAGVDGATLSFASFDHGNNLLRPKITVTTIDSPAIVDGWFWYKDDWKAWFSSRYQFRSWFFPRRT